MDAYGSKAVADARRELAGYFYRDAKADRRKGPGQMPNYRCPACHVTTYGSGGHSTANTCPNCSAALGDGDRTYVEHGSPTAVSCDLTAEPGAACAARRALSTVLENPDDDELDIASLLVTELIANSLQHSGMGASGIVRLDIGVTDELIRIEVRDQGSGFVPVARTPDSPVDSHWGLHLIEKLANDWGVAAEPPTAVWFELNRGRSGAATGRRIFEQSRVDSAYTEAGDRVH